MSSVDIAQLPGLTVSRASCTTLPAPAMPPVCASLADLFDAFRHIKCDSAPNRFRFTRTAFHPRGAAF